MSLNYNKLIIDKFVQRLDEGYKESYGDWHIECRGVICWAASMAAQLHANLGDAAYHNMEHIISVTLVGQEILRGHHIVDRLEPMDWMHFLIATAFHDIGFIRRLFRDDEHQNHVRGTTGASLNSTHVDRGKKFVKERFKNHPFIDAELIANYIEQTRFPIPPEDRYQETNTLRGLVRAADLIGQLGSLSLSQNQWALFQEFEENGGNESLGYKTVDDLRENFPSFFFSVVTPYIQDAIKHLERTTEGTQIVNNLYANVFRAQQGFWSTSTNDTRLLSETSPIGSSE